MHISDGFFIMSIGSKILGEKRTPLGHRRKSHLHFFCNFSVKPRGGLKKLDFNPSKNISTREKVTTLFFQALFFNPGGVKYYLVGLNEQSVIFWGLKRKKLRL